MKKILEEMLANVASKEASLYGVMVDDDGGQRGGKGVWSCAMKIAKQGKVEQAKLHQVGNHIRKMT